MVDGLVFGTKFVGQTSKRIALKFGMHDHHEDLVVDVPDMFFWCIFVCSLESYASLCLH